MTGGSSRFILGTVVVKQLPRRARPLAPSAGAARRSPRVFVWILAAACVVPLATPAGAFAHARVIRVEPADGAVVVSAPVAVHVLFNEPIRALQGIRAVRNGGGSVLGGPVHVVGGHELVILLHRPLEPGAYTVLWRVLSDDGHPVAGITTFAVGAGQPRPQPTLVAPSDHRAVPGVERWLFLGGVLLAVGLAAFRVTMPRAAAPSLRLLAIAFVLTGSGGGALVARGSLSTRFGLVVAVAVGIAILGAAACLAAAVVPRLATVAWSCGLALVLAPSAAGHALDPGRPRLEFPVDVLHVAASSVWFGGVVALVYGSQQGTFREQVVRRFSTLAGVAVAVIGVTGLVRAFGELSSFGQVSGTSYGRLLIVKTGLFGALIVFGWANRYRVIPALARSMQLLRRNLVAELVLLLGVVAAVALLTQSRPGRDGVVATPVAAAAAISTSVAGRPAPATPREAVVLAQAGRGLELAGEGVGGQSADGRSVLWGVGCRRGRRPGSGCRAGPRNAADADPRTGRRVAVRPCRDEAFDRLRNRTAPVRLIALDRRSGRRTVLADSLAAPFVWRGNLVAWAEQRGARQRVVVYDLRRHKAWTAADLPNCVGRLCYRIEGITLAERGVVFARGAVGAEMSFVLRRLFSGRRLESVRIERDAQPDLVPSANGAFYYVLDRGWYRWDFASSRPSLAAAPDSFRPIAYDGRRWLMIQQEGCDDALVEGLIYGPTSSVVSPARVQAVAGVQAGVCVRFQSVSFAGGRPVTTWIVVPRASHAAGAIGVIVIGRG